MAAGRKTGGRKKGTPNKLTGQVREMILAALDQAGGVNYLVQQAGKNPSAFLSLVGKVLPLQVTGKDGGPIEAKTAIDLSGAPEEVLRYLAEQRIDDDKR